MLGIHRGKNKNKNEKPVSKNLEWLHKSLVFELDLARLPGEGGGDKM